MGKRVCAALQEVGRIIYLGGPDIGEYKELMRRVAVIEGRKIMVVPVPLAIDVDAHTARSLIDSMSNEVIVSAKADCR